MGANYNNLWTKDDVAFLKKNYSTKGIKYCMEKLNRSSYSIQRKAKKLSLKVNLSRKKWTNEEKRFLIENYPKYGMDYCLKTLNRSNISILKKVAIWNIEKNAVPLKYQIEKFEPIVLSSKSYSDAAMKIGLSNSYGNRQTIKKYIKKYRLDISHFDYGASSLPNIGRRHCYELNEILVENSPYTHTTNLKNRLFDAGLKKRKCELCGQGEIWQDKQMSLILDHKNGINNDNRIENLRIVCPNCEGTLETHCKGNREQYETMKKQKSNHVAERIKNANQKPKDRKEHKDICACGNEKEKRSKVCAECYLKSPKRTVDRPPYEQLINEINELGFSATGRKYGVSDNAIRKWVKYYKKNKK